MQLDARAAPLTFRWDYATSGAAGFVLYCGPSSRTYATRVDVGNTETYTIGTLTEGKTSFCAVTAYDPAKVESTFSNEVSVLVPYAVPAANFSPSLTTGKAPLSVAFTNTTAGQVTAWLWNFGDGTASTLQSPTHIYSTPGTYTVVLTATGPGGTGSKTAATAIVVSASGGASGSASGSASGGAVPVPGLMAAYGFNEGSGTTVADSSGNGNTGTINGATWTTAGRYGNALSFNGTTSYVDLGNPASLKLTGSMTWSAWIYATANPADDGQIVAKSGDTGGWQLKTSPDTGSHTFGVGVSVDGTNQVQRYSNTIRALNTWYHVAGVYNAAARTLDIYVNGVLDNGVLRGAVPAAQYDPAQNVNIGRRSGGYYFNGTIDEVRIYNRALSVSEIQSDMNTPVGATTLSAPPPVVGLVAAYGFNEGSGTTVADSSGNGNTGTINGATWTTAGRYGNALSFNGTTSYVDLGNPASLKLTGSMTWSAWIYATANPADDGQIVAKSGDGGGWQLKTSPDTGSHTFGVGVSVDGTNHVQRYSNTTRALNTWYHVAGVYNAAARTLDIYVNGVLDNGVLRGAVPAAQYDAAQNVNIGRRSGGYYFKVPSMRCASTTGPFPSPRSSQI